MKPIDEMIKEFRERQGWSQQEFAAKLGTSQATVSDWEKRKTKPKIENVPALSKLMGMDMIQLVQLILGADGNDGMQVSEQNIPYLLYSKGVHTNRKELYADLPFASLKAQAGISIDNESCQLEWLNETYPVYLKGRTLNEKHLVIEIDGDSMTPGIVDGAHVLAESIATADIKYESGGVYAILFGNGRFVVKRIKTNTINSEGTLRLWSDNENYGYIDVPANDIHCMWKVIGKVWEPMK